MKKLPMLMIVLTATLFFLWSSASLAFEFLYEKDGISYYRTDAGKIISKEIPEGTEGLILLHQERNGRKKYYLTQNDRIIVTEQYGQTLISGVPDYEWWYGCSPTSAGMLMGYYDRNGYAGLVYPNLVPGGTAELNTFPPGTYIANDTIASSGHIADYYVVFNGTTDPMGSGRTLPDDFDCCADFMCTSNYTDCSNPDGFTTFCYWPDGSPTTISDIEDESLEGVSGTYGIKEYVEYRGYGYSSLYNQYGDFEGYTYGYTLAQFQNEIDNGRPVLIHTENHTLLGYGYAASTIYVRDTWASGGDYNGGTMPWGGQYCQSGGVNCADQVGVTSMTISGGSTPPSINIAHIIIPLLLCD